jgi:predicted DNA-binding ribbon-helix-helix protein
MKSPVIKRSIVIERHKTSVSIEDVFWASLKKIAIESGSTLSALVGTIDRERPTGNLSSAIRTFVLRHYRMRCGEVEMPAKHPREAPQPAPARYLSAP